MERLLSDAAVSRAAEQLVRARRNGELPARLDEDCRPRGHGDACAIFLRTAELLEEPIVGWKIGYSSRSGKLTLGPVLGSLLFADGAVVRDGPASVIAIEGEMSVTMRCAPKSAERAAVIEAIASAHPSIELVAPRFRDIAGISPFEAEADCGINGGLILGEGRPFVPELLEPARAVAVIDGRTEVDEAGRPVEPDAIEAIAWIAKTLEAAGAPLQPGHVIATGARTGLVRLQGGREVAVELGGLGRVSATIDR